MTKILDVVYDVVWGAPALLLIMGVGIWFSVATGFAQIRLFPSAIRVFFRKMVSETRKTNSVSGFQALCTALAATVGTGNLVGVAGAICIGGPGAVFWMWICGLIGMITKCVEVTLAVHFRQRSGNSFVGGPMYMISRGLPFEFHWLARLYAVLGVIACFGVGNATQINAVITGINHIFPVEDELRRNLGVGLLMCVMIGSVLLGGAGRIGSVAQMLVPFAAAGYILLCVFALATRMDAVLEALCSIFKGAYSPDSVTGGLIGSAFLALRTGCSRGVFTNEAGMGTASIAHASAVTAHPLEQGLMGVVEVFLDTIVICTMTALVILTSGIPIPYGQDIGGKVTELAFSHVFGDWVCLALTGFMCCFAFATILGWGLYGARCAQFLFGSGSWPYFAFAQTFVVILGAVLKTDTIWRIAEILNGLMAIPNLIALAVLAPVFIRLLKEYERNSGILDTSGGNYADFHQCKPL